MEKLIDDFIKKLREKIFKYSHICSDFCKW